MESTASEPSMSKYYSTLDSASKERYMDKLRLIGKTDPYCRMETRAKKSLPAGLEWMDWPDVLYADIYNYLILSPGMSHEKLKAFKSLEGYNHFTNGWVSGVVVTLVPNTKPKIYLFTAQVKHSQRLSDSSLKVWVAVKESGEVVCAHCNCMAGLGEVCSHVAAVLFTVEANTQVKKHTSSTSLPCNWLPPSFQTVPYTQVSNMDFTTPQCKRKSTFQEMNEDVTTSGSNDVSVVTVTSDENDVNASVTTATSSENNVNTSKDVSVANDITSNSCTSSNLMPQESSIARFYRQLATKTSGKPVILSLVPEYSNAYVPMTLTSNFPKPLSELFDASTVNLTFDELLNKCEDVYDTFTVTRDEAKVVEASTRKQAKCGIWFHQRAGRVTASKFKSAVCADPMQPSVSLVKSICYPTKSFKSAACEYGCKHENDARKEYEYMMKQHHQLFSVKESGLILDPMYPFLGASPDGVIMCSCCGTGVLEIKCPYSCRNKRLKDVSEEKSSFFLCVTEAGNLELKSNHQYFYQIQLQMKLCNVSFCDFVVWSKNHGILVQRIFSDVNFINQALGKTESFIKHGILPELVGNWYTKSKITSGNVLSCSTVSVSSCSAAVPSCSTVSSCFAPVPSCSTVSTCSAAVPSCSTVSSCSAAVSSSSQILDDATETWCYCGQDESYDKMIACEYPRCEIEWFHYSCIGLTEDTVTVPDGDWFCPDCQALSSKPKRAKS